MNDAYLYFGKRFDGEFTFISYSRADKKSVEPFTRLLLANNVFTFRDEESVLPGEKFREEIERSLKKAVCVLVFWSKNSSKSNEVKFEYELGISLGKRIVPVLLDRTALPAELSQRQYIDFSNMKPDTRVLLTNVLIMSFGFGVLVIALLSSESYGFGIFELLGAAIAGLFGYKVYEASGQPELLVADEAKFISAFVDSNVENAAEYVGYEYYSVVNESITNTTLASDSNSDNDGSSISIRANSEKDSLSGGDGGGD